MREVKVRSQNDVKMMSKLPDLSVVEKVQGGICARQLLELAGSSERHIRLAAREDVAPGRGVAAGGRSGSAGAHVVIAALELARSPIA